MPNIGLPILFLFLFGSCTGQKFELELGYMAGRIFKHKEELLFTTPPFSQAIEFNLIRHTASELGWQKFWNNPRFEGSLIYVNFGNSKVLGSAFGIVPSMAIPLFKRRQNSLMFHIGFGIAYLNRKYHITDNPTNNAIGSHLNNATRFKIRYEHRLPSEVNLSLGFSFLHFSNGLSSSPNSGINVMGLQAGISRHIFSLPRTTKEESVDTTAYNTFGMDFFAAYGASENKEVPGGPKYSVYSFTLGGYWKYKKYLSLLTGLDYEYNSKVFAFYKSGFATDEFARNRAVKTSIYLGHEAFFGDFSFRNLVGFYLPFPIPNQGEGIYFKTNINFYLLGSLKGIRPYIGAQLKTHFFVADYLSFILGTKF